VARLFPQGGTASEHAVENALGAGTPFTVHRHANDDFETPETQPPREVLAQLTRHFQS
jgi:hypothetical protein